MLFVLVYFATRGDKDRWRKGLGVQGVLNERSF